MFISEAYAQASQTFSPEVQSQAAGLGNLMPLFLILIVCYFFMIRPQQKRIKDQQTMVSAIKKGDRVLTAGGIIGSVSKVDADGFLHVEIAPGIRVKVVRDTVVNATTKGGESETDDKNLAGHKPKPVKSANDNSTPAPTAPTANDN